MTEKHNKHTNASGSRNKAGNKSHSGRPANPRKLVLNLLKDIMREQKTLDEALNNNKADFESMERRDRAFARLLISTLMRRLGQIDKAINACMKRRLPAKMADVRDIIRLGAVQLLYLDTPPHAAVSTSLDLARSPKLSGNKPVMNAVLRRLSREGQDMLAKMDESQDNLPNWLWKKWAETYGGATAKAISLSHLAEAPLDLTVKEAPAEWAEKLGGNVTSGNSIRLPAGTGDPVFLEGYEEGHWWVQDFAASLPVLLLGSVKGKKVGDICAAPGGKTAELVTGGADVTAVDSSAKRLTRVHENLERLQLDAEVIQADATTWQPNEEFDALLLDAPCSATGTLRKHPELGRIKRPEDIEILADLQRELLENCAKMVKPGGTIVYATCSLEPEEGQYQIQHFLKKNGTNFERVPVKAEELGSANWLGMLLTKEGDLRCLPCHRHDEGGMDGFYACRLRKIA
ncbi:MFS transporter [Kiloniella spongiae]|uniref:MFS transporter n=1 Tax=Kiloniella spongiae TaxID=1489064 RepID=A0A0H2ME00_9PROT|nr:transcription antitermination factor NusB [Kiloniella spongiae]KLN60774.1 MFS transporter [Kiloniella spongiae]